MYAGVTSFTSLLKLSIAIYLYQKSILHAKAYVFDEIFDIVGSANLDFQSLRKNDEGNVGVYNEGFIRKMIRIFGDDLQKSWKLELDEWVNRPFCNKVWERLFVMFRRRL